MNRGYALCLNEWALDKTINAELGLLLIISSLSAEKGYCYASNEYLAKLFSTTEITISRKIKKLMEKKYIVAEYEKRGAEVIRRKLRLTKLLTDDYQNCKPTINKNVKDNNTRCINNISINNKEIYKEKLNDKQLIDEFELIWKEYPKKQGKANALKSYIKARKKDTSMENVINGLKAYIEYIKLENIEQRYIKHGSTWFYQECWNDDYKINRKITTKDIAKYIDVGGFLDE